jgi:hypothetical protein
MIRRHRDICAAEEPYSAWLVVPSDAEVNYLKRIYN